MATDRSAATSSWLRRRWTCFREGHKWHLTVAFGPDFCERCGKAVEWRGF